MLPLGPCPVCGVSMGSYESECSGDHGSDVIEVHWRCEKAIREDADEEQAPEVVEVEEVEEHPEKPVCHAEGVAEIEVGELWDMTAKVTCSSCGRDVMQKDWSIMVLDPEVRKKYGLSHDHLIMPLVNLYTEEDAMVWCQVEGDGAYLYISEIAEMAIGSRPEWLDVEIGNAGLDGLMQIPHHFDAFERGSAHIYMWALKKGIAPYQPFLVRIDKPEWSGPDYEGEYDVSYGSKIVRIEPLPLNEAANRWEEALIDMLNFVDCSKEQARKEEVVRWNDVTSMRIRFDHYGSSFFQNNGIIVRLTSSHRGYLAEGRSDKGDHEEAWRKLIEYVSPRHPHLTEKVLRALPIDRRF